MKKCNKCGQIKDDKEFGLCSARKDKLQVWCKLCNLKNKKKNYYSHRRDAVQLLTIKSHLKSKYHITLEEYNNLLEKQKGVCAICGKKETQRSNKKGKIDRLRVDHNHETGNIRGLLCSKCNFGLGHFNDNVDLLLRAAEYLIENDSWIENHPIQEYKK